MASYQGPYDDTSSTTSSALRRKNRLELERKKIELAVRKKRLEVEKRKNQMLLDFNFELEKASISENQSILEIDEQLLELDEEEQLSEFEFMSEQHSLSPPRLQPERRDYREDISERLELRRDGLDYSRNNRSNHVRFDSGQYLDNADRSSVSRDRLDFSFGKSANREQSAPRDCLDYHRSGSANNSNREQPQPGSRGLLDYRHQRNDFLDRLQDRMNDDRQPGTGGDNQPHPRQDQARSSSGHSTTIPDMVMNMIRRTEAPQIEIEKWSGDPLTFRVFITKFKNLVEPIILDQSGRLNRLLQYVEAVPKSMIEHLIYDKNYGYDDALNILEKKYGQSYVMASAYEKELRNWPQVKDGDSLEKFYLFLFKSQSCLNHSDYVMELNTQENLRKCVTKLPGYIRDKWNRKATIIMTQENRRTAFSDFLLFLKSEVDIATNPTFSRDALGGQFAGTASSSPSASKYKKPAVRGYATRGFSSSNSGERSQSQSKKSVGKLYCDLCRGDHDLKDCEELKKKTPDEAFEIIKDARRCFKCLEKTSENHFARNCPNKLKCEICGYLHLTVLHRTRDNKTVREPSKPTKIESKEDKPSDQSSEPVSVIKTSSTQTKGSCLLPCVSVQIISKSEESLTAYCFLDSLADCSFVSEDIFRLLEVPPECVSEKQVELCTMSGTQDTKMKVIKGLEIRSAETGERLKLPELYVRPLPLSGDDIVRKDMVGRWPKLSKIQSRIADYDETQPILLLLGNNVPRALEPLEYITGSGNDPYAVRTRFGWTVSGPNSGCGSKSFRVTMKEELLSDLNSKLETMYKTDFVESHGNPRSQEDSEFVEQMENETKFENGHYTLPLPLNKSAIQSLENNREQALLQAESLKRRLLKKGNEELRQKYIDYMNDLFNSGHSELAPIDSNNQKWYLVYHNVVHPQKPDKFRIVFNCSKQYMDKSLNDCLKQGPDLTSTLIGVLTRFRQYQHAFSADIQGMFHQTRVTEDDRDLLRFFWWTDGENLNGDPVEYRMTVHLFGASSSPSVANYALRRTAEDNAAKFSEEAALSIKRNIYVDDLLKSLAQLDQGLAHEIYRLCRCGGFNLTKFVATDPKLLELIPPENVSTVNAVNFEQLDESAPMQRALGIHWDVVNDKLSFRISFNDRPRTRRGLLSSISAIWDALGLAAPFLLKGRKILQKLCRSEYGWDQELPDKIIDQWNNWRASLEQLHSIHLPRSFVKPDPENSPVVKSEIHAMCDASDIGYGLAIYVRVVLENGETNTSLVFGKSRVIPLDGESTPRSELVAAVMAAEFVSMINRELDYENKEINIYTDSMIVLGYLKNKKKKFKTFVANRVKRILDLTELKSWKFVPGHLNVADDASRGLDALAQRITIDHRWFAGPNFVEMEKSSIGLCEGEFEVKDDDIELKKDQTVLVTTTRPESSSEVEKDPVLKIVSVLSDWYRMKHRIASLIVLLKNPKVPMKVIDVERLRQAEIKILQATQKKYFSAEIQNLKQGLTVSSPSIEKLDPYIDQNDGLMKVGGRLSNSESLSDELKHPVILPKSGLVTEAIVTHYHAHVAKHGGRNATMNSVTSAGYWIVHASSKIKWIIHKCVECRKQRSKVSEQKMADLPADRSENNPPFTYVATDVFGPFLVKQGRKQVKRYGLIFTDLVYRGIHLEILESMSANSFILALRRFIARRGPVRLIRSDNGTNFVGATNELKEAMKEMDNEKVAAFLLKQNCDFKFNTPMASNHGGVWERMIRSVRQVLNSILANNPGLLNEESLTTFMLEAESVVNSRPLGIEALKDANSEPLTVMKLLTQKSQVVVPPPGQFTDKSELCSRKYWRRVQYLTEQFWNRFKAEYLRNLNERIKWNKTKRNIKVGDIVLLKEDSAHRNDWPIARVVEVYPNQDNFVRSVKLRMPRQEFDKSVQFLKRPITKLVVLIENDD